MLGVRSLSNTQRPEKQRRLSELTNEPSAAGMKMAKSKPSKRHQVNADTISSHSLLALHQILEPLCCTPELVLAPSNQISTDKLPHLETSTRKRKLSQKSVEDSTSSAKKCLPYWDKSCKVMSEWLSLPTKIGSQDLALTSFDGSVNNTTVNSWFSTKQTSVQSEKWLKTSWQSFNASVLD